MQQLYNPEKRFVVPQNARLFQDIFDIVMEDRWAFIVMWGEQRVGKSTLALWCPYFFWRMKEPQLSENELWERVYASCVFNLSQLIYKIEDPNMIRVWDWKAQHKRIPIIIWDDFGAHSNKAVTQHELAWDHFKGGFDILGTKFGVIIVTMTTPEEPTAQIEHKYTHEVLITSRGTYKYDVVRWQQDYGGWRPRHSKEWQQIDSFAEIPWQRFEPYDSLRLGLADEVIERIKDSMASRIPNVLNRLGDDDMMVLQELIDTGPFTEYKRAEMFTGDRKKIEVRLKAHQLVTIVRRGTAHWLDVTSYGMDVLAEWKKVKGVQAEETLQALMEKYKQLKKWKEKQEKAVEKLEKTKVDEPKPI